MIKRAYKYLALITLVVLSLGTSAWAIPNLQIYIPGAEYVVETDADGNTWETWVINSLNYELWVIGANYDIFDVKFAAAVPTDQDGTIEVTWRKGELHDRWIDAGGVVQYGDVLKGPTLTETLTEDGTYITFKDGTPTVSFTGYGTPILGDGEKSLPPHGVFPTSYYEYWIGNFSADKEKVYNYVPDPDEEPSLWDEYGNPAYGSGYGEVKKFWISVSGYTWVDMVAYDHIFESDEKTRCCFTPFSHDGAATPEPATMLLVGTGLIGLGWTARRKFKK